MRPLFLGICIGLYIKPLYLLYKIKYGGPYNNPDFYAPCDAETLIKRLEEREAWQDEQWKKMKW
jgi:hypothetical protein